MLTLSPYLAEHGKVLMFWGIGQGQQGDNEMFAFLRFGMMRLA
jgi:hypothetical protein